MSGNTGQETRPIRLTGLEADTLSSTLSNLLEGDGCGTVQMTLLGILRKLEKLSPR